MPTTAEKAQFVYDPTLEDEAIKPSYENASTGTVAATLVDLIPLGLVKMPAMNPGEKEREVFRVTFVFAIEERNSKDFQFTVRRQLTLSLHKKSTMRPYFEVLAGRKVTPDEEAGKKRITVKTLADELIGKSALLNLVSSPDGAYTNVAGIIPLPAGMPAPKIDSYLRLKDRSQ